MAQRNPAVFDKNDPSSPSSIPPSQTALLLCDYQNMITSMLGPLADPALTEAAHLRDWAHTHALPIIHVTIDPTTTPPPRSSKSFTRFTQLAQLAATNSTLLDIHPTLTPTSANETTMSRTGGHISALYANGMRPFLEVKGIKSLIVAGLTSSGIVLSTARAAYEEGYVVTVAEDACADRTEEVQRVLMGEVLASTAHVARGEMVRGKLDRAWS